jgi:hypothetical protein
VIDFFTRAAMESTPIIDLHSCTAMRNAAGRATFRLSGDFVLSILGTLSMARFPVLIPLLAALGVLPLAGTEKSVIDGLVQLARTQPASEEFKAHLIAVMGAENIRKGTAIAGNGRSFVWAVESSGAPVLYVNDEKYASMQRVSGNLWFHAGHLKTGNAYKFHYMVDGAVFGGALNIPAYTDDSYAQPGVPQGTLSEKMAHVSKKIYPGMQTNYWVYLPAGYDAAKPVPLMIWQDGERLAGRNNEEVCILCPGLVRILEVTENLLAQKRIPMMAHLFVQHALDRVRFRHRQISAISDRGALARSLREIQHPPRRIQPRDSRPVFRRHLRV